MSAINVQTWTLAMIIFMPHYINWVREYCQISAKMIQWELNYGDKCGAFFYHTLFHAMLAQAGQFSAWVCMKMKQE